MMDLSVFICKFKFALNNVNRKINGVSVNVAVPLGLYRALRSNIYDDIIIAVDGSPDYNTAILPQYKAHRMKESDENVYFSGVELIKFLTGIGEVLGKNIKVVASPGEEADQVISSVVHMATGQSQVPKIQIKGDITVDKRLCRYARGLTTELLNIPQYDYVVIGSTDSDMAQLMECTKVAMDHSTIGRSIVFGDNTPAAVKHLPPAMIPCYKAFIGDVSDNIPQIELGKMTGIEQKLRFLARYFPNKTHLEGFINRAQSGMEQPSKVLQKLQEYLIKTGQLKKLKVNFNVANLKFFSIPQVLSYQGYDVKTTISKYNL